MVILYNLNIYLQTRFHSFSFFLLPFTACLILWFYRVCLYIHLIFRLIKQVVHVKFIRHFIFFKILGVEISKKRVNLSGAIPLFNFFFFTLQICFNSNRLLL